MGIDIPVYLEVLNCAIGRTLNAKSISAACV